MTIYEKNLSALEKYDSNLYEYIKTQEQETDCSMCSIVMSKIDKSLICMMIDGKEYIFGSRYNPDVEAQRFAKQYESVTNGAHMTFLGLGSGLIAREIVSYLKDEIHFLFYEPSIEIFLFTLNNFDITDLIENERVRIMVKGYDDDNVDAEIGAHITVSNYQFSTYDALPQYRKLFEMDFDKLKAHYCYIIETVKTNIITGQHFAHATVKNEIANFKEIFHCNCLEDFEECFPLDRPAVLVAAGPSLEKNVHLLKEAKGKFLIIGVDSALRYLVEQEIMPDVALVADPLKPVRLFENEKIRQIPLAFYTGANNEIIKLMKHQKLIVASADSAYSNRLFEIAGKHMYTLNGGGSVATYAFVLLMAWGYKKIVLLGQDLALAADKVHAGNDDLDLHKLNDDKIEIEGYYGDKVYTYPDYDYYRRWYEMAIRRLDDIEVINSTEGGAKIKGATQKSFREVIDEYRDVEPFDFEGYIKKEPYTFEGESIHKVKAMFEQSVRNCDNLKRELNAAKSVAERGALLINEKRYTIVDIRKLRKKLSDIVKKINTYDEIFYLNEYIQKDFGCVLEDLLNVKEDDMEECSRMFNKMAEYVGALASVSDEIKEMFEDTVSSMKEE